jgi:exosortase H (IPTLxxWG-CTERM-specific)
MTRFLFIFCTVLGSLFAIEMLKPVQEAVIQPFTGFLAALSTALILPFDDTVIAQGRILRDAATGFAVSIEAGCNGVEAAIVLIAGILAFPASFRYKLVAILVGFFFVQALNVVRIISLFYLGQWNYTVFEWFHLYLWPVLIMLDVLIVFAIYLQWLGKHHTQPEPTHADPPPVCANPCVDAYYLWHLVRRRRALRRSSRMAM